MSEFKKIDSEKCRFKVTTREGGACISDVSPIDLLLMSMMRGEFYVSLDEVDVWVELDGQRYKIEPSYNYFDET